MIIPRYISKVAKTRPNDTIAYTAGDVLGTDPATVIEFTNIAPVGGGTIVLLYASLMISAGSVAGLAQTRLHFYSSAPSGIADNEAYNLPSGDRANYVGSLTLGAPLDLGDTMFSEDDFLRKTVTASSSSLFAIAQTVSAWNPAANTVKTWELRSVEA